MNNQGIQSLRVPAAWALLGAVGAQMLGGLVYIFSVGGPTGSVAQNINATGGASFFGPIIIALLLGAVFLVITAPQRSAAFPVVLTALVLSGVAALVGVISLITGFVVAGGGEAGSAMGVAFADFFRNAGYLGVLAFAGVFMLKVFGDRELVPRAAPAAPMVGRPQGFAPQTGAQQAFGAYAPQGYATGAQPGFQQDWAAQQPYVDPAQQGYVDPAQQGYVDPAQQGYPNPYQQPYANPYQQPYADPNQSVYAQGWPQPGDPHSQPSGAQQGYQNWQYQQPMYNQPGYGQDWPAEHQVPYAGQPGYPSGGQPAGYDAYAAHQGYGTGPQAGYSGAYDPAQYAPQGYGEAAMAPGTDPGQSGEQAAQEAIQYGWYQQPADQGGERRDTPTESFFVAEEQNTADAAGRQPDPGYAQFGTGASYPENYLPDQHGQAETGEGWQAWYRDEGHR